MKLRLKRSIPLSTGPYVVILLLAFYLLYETFKIAPAPDGQLGAGLWPKTILFLVILTCGWEIVRNTCFRTADEMHEAPERISAPERQQPKAGAWAPWIGIALTAAYVFSFPEIGYFTATAIFVAAFIYFGSYRRPFIAAIIGLISSFAFVFIFMKIVYVSLPMGAGPFGVLSALIMTTMGIK